LTPSVRADETRPGNPTKRIAIVLTNHEPLGETGRTTGFYLSEATHPHKVFVDAGYEVEFISPKGGLAPMDGVNRDDPINAAFLDNERLVAQTRNTIKAADVSADRYDAIFFAGGHGTMWDFPDDETLQKLTAALYERGGVVAAVCHGPAALVNVSLANGKYLVAGKEVAGFTNEEESAVSLTDVVPFLLETVLIDRGAKFTKGGNFQKHVAVSDRLVTGQNPASATATAEAVLRVLAQQKPRR
jgi:putative intracellular protease/amidase